LKLWPQLRSTSTALVAVPEVAAAVSLLAVLRETAGERVNSFELLPRAAMELTQRHIEGIRDPLSSAHPWYVLCELSSANIEPLDGLLEQALTQASAAGLVSDAVICANERQRSLLWRLRENIPEAQRRAGPSLKHDIALPLGKLAEFVAQAASWVRASVPDATLIAYGHAGDGNLHFNLSFPREATAASVAALEPTVRRAIHDLVASHGGSFSAEHGIGQLKTGELQRYTSAVELNLMREIKRALDPHGIMNPGKVLTTC
jgi:FAD/FMN-containing dehydrogenase